MNAGSYTRHTSSCMCVGYIYSPDKSAWSRFERCLQRPKGVRPMDGPNNHLPDCILNYFGYTTEVMRGEIV